MKTPTISDWREKLLWLTRGEATTLLRRFSRFTTDEILIVHKGIHKIQIGDLWKHFKPGAYCINIRPVYFEGGPFSKRFKGTLLTVVIDRLIVMQRLHGVEFVINMVKYARAYNHTTVFPNSVANSVQSNTS